MDLLQRGAISTKGYDPPDSEGEAINRFKVIIKLFSVQEDPCVMLGVTKDELVSLNRILLSHTKLSVFPLMIQVQTECVLSGWQNNSG